MRKIFEIKKEINSVVGTFESQKQLITEFIEELNQEKVSKQIE